MDSLEKRISRISGQLRGIQKMVEEKRNSTDILQQISAVKKAINGLTKEIIFMDLASQDLTPAQRKKLEEIFDRAVNL
jgi:DNA-binding FrmR family transcriptional regulator